MTLFVIPPQPVTEETLVSASMGEDNETFAWAAGASYPIGARVHSPVTHRRYEAVKASTGLDPALPANQYADDPAALPSAPNSNGSWLDAGATNRWRALDGQLGDDPCRDTDDLRFEFRPSSMVTAVALINVKAASVRVAVAGEPITDATEMDDEDLIGRGGLYIYDRTVTMVDNSDIGDWWDWTYVPVRGRSTVVFQGVPGFTALPLIIEIKSASGVRSVGEIVLGHERAYGKLLVDAATDINDYTRYDTDAFGNETVIRRAYADRTTFPLMLGADEVDEVKRDLASLRGIPSVYHAGEGLEGLGLTIYGTFRRLPITIRSGLKAQFNLEVQGRI